MPSTVVILGSAFARGFAENFATEPRVVETEWGAAEFHPLAPADRGPPPEAYALFRHGLPHRLLPNQINYRANAAALRQLDCGALLVNSSVGVLDAGLPLHRPMLLADLMMPENRLPDGSPCTLFPQPTEGQGHLVLNEGLFSRELSAAVHGLEPETIRPADAGGPVFAYAGGPRTKTPAENAALARDGAHVNSMTLAPEVILANELGIPCAGLVVGHKYSVPGVANPDAAGVAESLDHAREATGRILLRFLREARPVPFRNHLHRF